MIDEAKPVRFGEEIDEARLLEFLGKHFFHVTEEIKILQFPSGSSNLTYLVLTGDKEFVLRRPPFGNQVKSAHDMRREYNVLSKLCEVYPLAPTPVLFCDDTSILGVDFYLMERRTGVILRKLMPDGFAQTTENARKICETFVENLVALHRLDYKEIGLNDFGHPDGYTHRQIEGWTKRYFNAKTDEWRPLEDAARWLHENIPPDDAPALIHNDYKFDNLVLNPQDLTETVAVLDWEMATIGSPLMDFGTTLGYWADRSAPDRIFYAGFNPPFLMTEITRRDLAEMYAEKSGRDTSNILFYYVFGLFKIAVIAQQIYFRYAQGFTQDARFAEFRRHVEILGLTAAGAIEKQKI